MFPCPVCGGRIVARGDGQWFQCQYCGNWLCQRTGTNNTTWLDVGIQANGSFTVVVLNTQRQAPAAARTTSQPALAPPDQLSLQEVQTERQRVNQQLQTLTANIQRVVDQMTQNRQDIGRITRLNAEITGYNQLQTTLTEREAILAARETTLMGEQRQSRRSNTGASGGGVFGWITALVIIAFIAFGFFVKFSWDIKSAFIAAIISVVCGFVVSIFS